MIIAVLAAGESQRFGSPKQLSEFRGKTLLQSTLDNLPEVAEACLVLGAYKELIEKEINTEGFTVLHNCNYKKGLSTSVKLAMQYALEKNQDLLITLGDLPLITKENYQELIDQMNEAPVFSSFNDTHGPPVVIPNGHLVFSKNLQGDKGLKSLFLDFDQWPMPSAGFDIDTMDDLSKLK